MKEKDVIKKKVERHNQEMFIIKNFVSNTSNIKNI